MPQSGPGANARPSCHVPVVPAPTRDDQSHGQAERTPVRFYTPRRGRGQLHRRFTALMANLSCRVEISGSKIRRAARLSVFARVSFAGALLLVLATMVLSSTSALAAETHLFEEGFGPDGTSATAFTQPEGLAVDQSTGELYLRDGAEGTVQKFNSAHEPVAFTGIAADIVAGKLTGLGNTAPISVSSTDHDLYAIVEEGTSLRAFQSDGEPADFTAGPGIGTNEIGGFSLQGLKGVAVDGNGDIYAVTNSGSGVEVYASDGALLVTISGASANQIAVDSDGDVYLDKASGEIEKLIPSEFPVTSSTTYTVGEFANSREFSYLALDPATNDLYVDERSRISEYDEAGVRVGSFAAEGVGALTNSGGLAINAVTGAVYASDEKGNRQVNVFAPAIVIPGITTAAASEIGPTSVVLNGSVGPDEVQLTDCHFDYGTTTGYGQTAPCEPAADSIPADSGEHAVTAKLQGLQQGVTYHYRLQAENANKTPNLGADGTFATPPRPAIDAATAANVTAESADLNAKIDPGSTDPGAETTYHFEYGTSLSYGTIPPPSEATIAPGIVDVAVTRHIESLKANITYHWRVVATNASGTTYGADHTFIYDESGSGVLPDGRAYEMVTPPAKNGALIGDAVLSPLPSVASDGDRLILGSVQCFGDVVSCEAERYHTGSPYLFTRTPSGWTSASMSPPATTFAVNTWTTLYSADSDEALFSAPTAPFGEDDFYARAPDETFTDVGPFSSPAAGPSTGHDLQEWAGSDETATGDLSHIVYTAPGGTWPAFEAEAEGQLDLTLFEYSGTGDAAPSLVGVSGPQGSHDLVSDCGTYLGGSSGEGESDTMSEAGNRIFFTALPCGSSTGSHNGKTEPAVNELFARLDNTEADAKTASISEPDALSSPEPGEEPDEECTTIECLHNLATESDWRTAGFSGASNDGSQVYFTDPQQLTNEANEDPTATDSGNGRNCVQASGANGCNLYLYDFDAESGHRLVDVSAGAMTGGPRVQGVLADSADGSHVYFVAQGVLTKTSNAQGQSAVDGGDNLYVYERDSVHPAGRVAFIATTPSSDIDFSEDGPGAQANVSPEGRFLVFTSAGRLTADDSRTDGAQQVFRYDAMSEELTRISIGERGFNDDGNAGAGNARIVPGKSGFDGAGVGRRDPTMSDDGRYVFFMSPVALVPGALSSVQIRSGEHGEPEYAENIYEYHEGHVSLISDGRDTSEEPSEVCGGVSATCLIGSDATGSNVFFATADQLVPQDTDTQVDIYDARICTAASPCLPSATSAPAGCLGEACHGTPPAASPLLAPGSASFDGAGNFSSVSAPAVRAKRSTRAQKLAAALKVCRRDRKKGRRRACEELAKRKFSVKSSTKTRKAGSGRGGR
jgi:hypothetical protein